MRALAHIGAGVLDQLGLASAHVLGVSFGGAVGQQMALSHPGRVDRLILASTSYGGFTMPGHPAALLQMMHPGRPGDHRVPARRGRAGGASGGLSSGCGTVVNDRK